MNPPTYQQETGHIHHQLHSKMADTFLHIQVYRLIDYSNYTLKNF